MARARPFCSLLVLICAGCPYVFGPPDLSRVGLASTGDTGAPTETEPPQTGDTGAAPDPMPPEVLDLGLKRFPDRIGLSFALSDEDGDLEGGVATITNGEVGSAPIIIAIPDGFQIWDPDGRSVIALPTTWLPCEGLNERWSVTLTDADGDVGPTAEREISIFGLGLLPEYGDVYDFGLFGDTLVTCIAFDYDEGLPIPPQDQLVTDFEDLRFSASLGGPYSFQIAWQTTMDIDLSLNLDGIIIAPLSGPVIGEGWENFEADLSAGVEYRLNARYYSIVGNEAPYVATILMGPTIQ